MTVVPYSVLTFPYTDVMFQHKFTVFLLHRCVLTLHETDIFRSLWDVSGNINRLRQASVFKHSCPLFGLVSKQAH